MVHGLRGEGDEVPEIIMRRLGLRYLVVRFGLHSMNEVRELDRFLDEKLQRVLE